MKQNLCLACAAVLLMCCAITLCAQSDQPSLADIARQKSAHKAKRVVTNEEIPPSPEADNSASSKASGAGGSGKADSSGDKRESTPKSPAPLNPETQIQQLMTENDNLQKITKKLQDKIEASADRGRIATLSEVVQHAKSEIAANQAKIDKLKSAAAATSPAPASP